VQASIPQRANDSMSNDDVIACYGLISLVLGIGWLLYVLTP
jgi:hypothetical protein